MPLQIVLLMDGWIISSLGTVFFKDIGLETASIASVIDKISLAPLLKIFGMTVMQLSRYMSIFS